jgi:hypothetical protein
MAHEQVNSRSSNVRDRILHCTDIVRSSSLDEKDKEGLAHWLSDALLCAGYGNVILARQILSNTSERMAHISTLPSNPSQRSS